MTLHPQLGVLSTQPIELFDVVLRQPPGALSSLARTGHLVAQCALVHTEVTRDLRNRAAGGALASAGSAWTYHGYVEDGDSRADAITKTALRAAGSIAVGAAVTIALGPFAGAIAGAAVDAGLGVFLETKSGGAVASFTQDVASDLVGVFDGLWS